MYRNALFFTRICFWVLPMSLFISSSISQATSKKVSSACQKTSLPNICERLATLYKKNHIPFQIKTPNVCSWKEIECNDKKQVIGLNFYGKDIKVLPSDIFSGLSQLQDLDLGKTG